MNTIYTENAKLPVILQPKEHYHQNGAHVTIQATISLSENSNIIVERGAAP
ncbi:MAG: hypothetical protein IPH36_15750 [Saprospiraceae bacterium]|nr:hypothetical protein [Saprospiraceae bacterium]